MTKRRTKAKRSTIIAEPLFELSFLESPKYLEQVARRFFRWLQLSSDSVQAKRIFLAIVRDAPQRPRGRDDPQRDEELLRRFDSEGISQRRLAKLVVQETGRRFGETEEGVRQRLRRLLGARRDKIAEVAKLDALMERLETENSRLPSWDK